MMLKKRITRVRRDALNIGNTLFNHGIFVRFLNEHSFTGVYRSLMATKQ